MKESFYAMEQKRWLKFFRPLVEIAFIIHWLFVLRATDSLFSAYVFWAILAMIALADNVRSDRWLTRSTGRERIWRILFSIVFSVSIFLSNYRIFFPSQASVITIALLLIESYFISGNIFLCFLSRIKAPSSTATFSNQRIHAKRLFLISFACISAVDILFLFLCYYPGNLTYDSVNQIEQISSGAYTNHHPFWHTMIMKASLDLGMLLFQDINKAVALYSILQILIMAGIFAFLLMTLYQAGVSHGWILFALASYAIFPYHILYSFTMWKDVLFGGAVALFGCSLYREMKGIGHKRTNDLTFIAGAIGFGLLRNNGWLPLCATFIASVFILGKKYKRILWITLAVLLFTFILKNPFLKLMNVAPTEIGEYLSIPIQQIARVIADDGELTAQEQEQLEMILDFDIVKEEYRPYTSDPVKYVINHKNPDYLNAHLPDYLKLWLQVGIRHPVEYLFAWIDQTVGYWNGGYHWFTVSDSVYSNDFGIERTKNNSTFAAILRSWSNTFFNTKIFEPFRSVGLHVWLTILAFVASVIRKRNEGLIYLSLLLLNATLLVSTPVFCEFRYAYAIFTSFPLISLLLV